MVKQSVGSSVPALKWTSVSEGPIREVTPPAWLGVGLQPEGVAEKGGDLENILFVCTGNICRSAFASAYLGYLLKDSKAVVESAGTEALVGHAMDERALLMADHLGFDGSAHRARQLTGRMLNAASLVVVFGPEHYNWVRDNNPEAIAKTIAIGDVAEGVPTNVQYCGSTSQGAVDLLHSRGDKGDLRWVRDPYRRSNSEYVAIMKETARLVECLKSMLAW